MMQMRTETQVTPAMAGGPLRVNSLVYLPDVLVELGHAPEPIIRRAGLDPAALASPENLMEFPEAGRLLRECVAATGCGHFGLLVGQKATSATFGLVGALMRNAPTVRDAMLDMAVHQPRYARGAVVFLLRHAEEALWGHGMYYPGTPALEQIGDTAISVGVSLLREWTGKTPDAVLLARSAPASVGPYRRAFGVTPQFDAEQNALVVSAKTLGLPVRGADAAVRARLEEQVAQYWAVRAPSVAESVVRYLRARVVCCEPILLDVAAALGMSARTLNRVLQVEGTNFRALRNEVRMEVARQLLGGTRMSVTGIALALSYAETSVFTRAFRNWSGMTPRAWRAWSEAAVENAVLA